VENREDEFLLREDLRASIKSTEPIHDRLQTLKADVLAKVDSAQAGHTEALHSLQKELSQFYRHVQEENQRYCILKELRFERIENRFDDVKKEHAKTFEWIFENQLESDRVEDPSPVPHNNTPFTEWLRTGRGVFHVQGKAGSGKSTLMKFICRDPRTKQSLELWCDGDKLVFGKFFFWKPGTPMQRSLKGLMRSLLHSILEQVPELIEHTFPSAWKEVGQVPWNVPCNINFSLPDIEEAFVLLTKDEKLYESRRFCFFIDGLDEFDEVNGLDPEQTCYTDLIKLLSTWAQDRH
jgi:hypothetical protein